MNRYRLVMILFFLGFLEAYPLQAQTPSPSGQPLVNDAVEVSDAPVPGSDAVTAVPRKRDPFWPVGYTPKIVRKIAESKAGGVSTASRPQVEAIQSPRWEDAMRRLDIRGISLIGRDKESGKPKYLAMVAGRLVEEGNVVSVTLNDFIYRWKVVGIGTAGVSFQKLDVRKE